MTSFMRMSWRLPATGALAATLASCGGGGLDGGSVNNISATSIAYGRAMTVTVSGQQLESTNYIKAEGCENAAPAGTGSSSTRTYTCTVRKVGPMTVRVHNQKGEVLGSVRITVPKPQVRFTTRLGSIVVELEPEKAPVTVDNFLAYVGTSSSNSFYTNTLFHRVIKDFVIQAGGYLTGLAPKAPTRAPIVLESNNGLSNLRGTIAMARTTAPNSATTQFYINTRDNPNLDYKSDAEPGYAVFGQVVEGMPVVEAIENEPTTTKPDATGTTLADVPVSEVVITATTRVQ